MAEDPGAGQGILPVVRLGAAAARWLVCGFLALSAVSGAWQRVALEQDWPLVRWLAVRPVLAVAATVGLLALGMCAVIEWRGVRKPAYAGRPRLALASLAIALLCGWLVVPAVAAAPEALLPEAAWEGAGRLVFVLALGLLAWLARPRPRQLALALGAAAAVHALVGIGQFVLQSEAGLMALGELPALDPRVSGVSVVDVAGQHWLRAYGLSAHPNVLGGFLCVTLLLLVGMRSRNELSPRERRALGLVVIVGLAALLLTFSRSAWIGLACGLGVFAWVQRRRRLRVWRAPRGREWLAVLAACAVVAVALAVVGPLIVTRVTGGGSPLEARSIDERRYYLAAAWDLLAQSPWRGAGMDNSGLAVRDYLGETGRGTGAAYVHNVALMAALELGAGGGAVWIILGAVGVLVPWLAAWRGGAPDAWGTALGAAWLALWVIGLFDYYPWSALRNGMIWPVLLGLWIASWPDLL